MNASPTVQCIVGLANPGAQYANTRHNAGAWFVEQLAEQCNVTLAADKKFQGLYGKITLGAQHCHLLIPTTYMNCSGRAVASLAKFYKIPIEHFLIAHDEIDLPAGTVRLKISGGHGGHNGLRDIVKAMDSRDFARLRVGVGHPGHKDRVHDYVLSVPSRTQAQLITDAINSVHPLMNEILGGQLANATKTLHTQA